MKTASQGGCLVLGTQTHTRHTHKNPLMLTFVVRYNYATRKSTMTRTFKSNKVATNTYNINVCMYIHTSIACVCIRTSWLNVQKLFRIACVSRVLYTKPICVSRVSYTTPPWLRWFGLDGATTLCSHVLPVEFLLHHLYVHDIYTVHHTYT